MRIPYFSEKLFLIAVSPLKWLEDFDYEGKLSEFYTFLREQRKYLFFVP